MTDAAEAMAFVRKWLSDVDNVSFGEIEDRVVSALRFPNGRTLYMVAWIDDDGQPDARLWDVDDSHALDDGDLHHLWDHYSRESAIRELDQHAAAHRSR